VNRALVAAALVVSSACAASAGEKDVYRIGIPKSAFRDLPPGLIGFAGQPFKDLMKAQTGLKGEAVIEADALTIAGDIDAGKLQMGVLFGHEFAWAKEKYPNLEPIVCAVPRPRTIQAFLLVHYENKAATLSDLKGKKLVLATTSRDHARLFLEKQKGQDMGGETFGSTEKVETVHDAIHQVIDGEADVTVADSASWNYFQKLFPGRSQNIRVLAESEVFPPTVLAYKKRSLDDTTLKAIRDGLMSATDNPKAVRIMNLIRVERFDAVAADYIDAIKACRKAYPTPLAEK
jgi:ABC-type phosphate/phosphonate transport system substrate-binding protein